MNRFGTFARNRQNGFVALTICFVAALRDDTFAAGTLWPAAPFSGRVSAASCPFGQRRALDVLAIAAPAGPASQAAAVLVHPAIPAAATVRLAAATVLRHPVRPVLPVVANAAD
jgi:hypothetical protein